MASGPVKLRAFVDDKPTILPAFQVLGPVLAQLIGALMRPVRAHFSAADGTLSAGQTVLTVPGGYTPGLATVYRNGLLARDATATNGATVTFDTPLDADDVVDVLGLRAGLVADVAPLVHQHSVQDLTDATNAWFESLYDRWLASLPVYSGDGPAPVPAGRYYNNNGRPEKAQ